jgi:hypothetical protein
MTAVYMHIRTWGGEERFALYQLLLNNKFIHAGAFSKSCLVSNRGTTRICSFTPACKVCVSRQTASTHRKTFVTYTHTHTHHTCFFLQQAYYKHVTYIYIHTHTPHTHTYTHITPASFCSKRTASTSNTYTYTHTHTHTHIHITHTHTCMCAYIHIHTHISHLLLSAASALQARH